MALEAARTADPDGISVREMSAMFVLEEARRRLLDDREPNRGALLEAGEEFASLMRDMLEAERFRGRRHWRSSRRGAAARERAGAVLDTLLEHPMTFEKIDVRKTLGEAALHAERPELVARLLPEDIDDVAALIRAEALVTGDGDDLLAGVDTLRQLMRNADDEPVRLRGHGVSA